ncbi:PIN domain-like protein [Hortaea werneckii]|nr:PIN domain-like protein [Hortaea werneckii]
MFQDRMEFSKFQIARVAERNELTTRLMNINEGDAAYAAGGIGTGSNRVAGEKAREYVLVKNEGVEGGWALGVISDEGTKQETAIDLDKPAPSVKVEESDEEDDGFEDVPIEGLNRLPKRRKLNAGGHDGAGQQPQTTSTSRQPASKRRPARKVRQEDPESLFVGDEEVEEAGEDEEAEWEDVDANRELFGEADENEDEDLRQAIAMSLEKDHDQGEPRTENMPAERSDSEDDMLEVFQQRAVEESRPVPKGSARAIANLLNKRAHDIAPDSQEVTSFGVPVPKQTEQESDEDDSMDLQAALAESRKGKRKVSPPQRRQPQPARQSASLPKAPEQTEAAKANGFSGPLPFEKLDLGTSLLGRKKMKDREEEAAGGFEHPAALEQQRKGEPLPPWFSGNVEEDMEKQRGIEREDRERAKEFSKQFMFQSRDGPALQRKETKEVIDVDTSDDEKAVPEGMKGKGGRAPGQTQEVIDLDADEVEAEELAGQAEGKDVDKQVRMGDVADVVRAEPPEPPLQDEKQGETPGHHDVQKTVRPNGPFEVESEDEEEAAAGPAAGLPSAEQEGKEASAEEEEIEWSESDDGKSTTAKEKKSQQAVSPVRSVQETAEPKSPSPDFEDVPNQPGRSEQSPQPAKSPSPQFEDVNMEASRQTAAELSPPPGLPVDDDEDASGPAPASGLANQDNVSEGEPGYFDDDFDDPEEEALLSALAQEAEEHARFASTLNNKTTTAQNILDYENELKQLRNQQKKDRRDADEVTHIMVQECQQLLRLFGLPYVTAPMEAEAQCAELVKLGLVDGIVTDDSDCFLFGGTRIYKNMFNQAKFVECYLTSDLEKEFNLTRVKLIAIAQLLGSDYTEGLQGVGPVTALEILGEFQNLEGFKEWWEGVQMQLIPKEADKDHPFRKKFRKNATKMFLPPSFPDPRVEKAYLEPEVDRDPEHFQWGVPDLDALRSFLMSTIGWGQERTDEVLVPVIKDMNRRADEGTQSNLTAFFEGGVGIGAAGSNAKGEAFAPRKRLEGSKRMGAALGRMAARAQVQRGEPRAEDEGPEHQAAKGPDGEGSGSATAGSKRREARENPQPETISDEDASEFEEPRKRTKRKSRGSKAARGRSRQKAALEE